LIVRNILETARDAVLQIRRFKDEMAVMESDIGVHGHGYDYHQKTGILDPMRKVDAILDARSSVSINEPELQLAIDEAREIVAGISHIADPVTVESVEMYYLCASSWLAVGDMVAEKTGMMRDMDRKERAEKVECALENQIRQWEAIGVARLRDYARS
jgi:hypothetical protein